MPGHFENGAHPQGGGSGDWRDYIRQLLQNHGQRPDMGDGGRGMGWGGGFGGGRVRRPMMQAWSQQFADQPRSSWMPDFRTWMQSQPMQDWRAQAPQRPEGGWADPAARQTAMSGWYNQMPDAPWGPMPDWTGQMGQGWGGDNDWRRRNGGVPATGPVTPPPTGPTPPNPSGNAWGRRFQDLFGSPPGQMRDQFRQFHQNNRNRPNGT